MKNDNDMAIVGREVTMIPRSPLGGYAHRVILVGQTAQAYDAFPLSFDPAEQEPLIYPKSGWEVRDNGMA